MKQRIPIRYTHAGVVVVSALGSQVALDYGERNELIARLLVGTIWIAAGGMLALAFERLPRFTTVAILTASWIAALTLPEDDTSQGLYILGHLAISMGYFVATSVCLVYVSSRAHADE
jgi:hypothetical protein